MTKRNVVQNRDNLDHLWLIRCEHHLGVESGELIRVVGVGVGVGVGGHRIGL